MINEDFDLVVSKFPRDMEEMNIYPLGDAHFGAKEFDYNKWKKWKQMVLDDPNGYIIIVGDMLENNIAEENNFKSIGRNGCFRGFKKILFFTFKILLEYNKFNPKFANGTRAEIRKLFLILNLSFI